jgi:hypothetical protein
MLRATPYLDLDVWGGVVPSQSEARRSEAKRSDVVGDDPYQTCLTSEILVHDWIQSWRSKRAPGILLSSELSLMGTLSKRRHDEESYSIIPSSRLPREVA